MSFLFFDELANSPVLDISPDQSRATREAKIPGSEVANFTEFIFPAAGFGPPRQFPGKPSLVARSLHFEPFAGESQPVTDPDPADLDYDSVNTWDWVKVRVEYETPPYSPDEQGNDPVLLLSHRWSIGGEFLTVESKGLKWADGGIVDEDVTAGILIPTIEHQMTWPRVERPPFSVIRDRIGCVNDDTMLFSTGRIFPETLLFLGAELRRDILTTGALAWEVIYRFSERRVPSKDDPGEYNDNEDGCVARGGIWDGLTDTCSGTLVGGWNHFFRSEKDCDDPEVECNSFDLALRRLDGWYRLQTKSGDPIYYLKSFVELFVEGT